MATEYLAEGAVTFAAAAWSGSGIADSNDYVIEYGFGTIAAGLDQSSLTTGIESMYFKKGSSGTVGGGALGSLLIDADNSADAFVNNYGDVTLYITAGGGSGVINNFACGPGSVNYLTGGTFSTVTHDGGSLTVNASTIVTTYSQASGNAKIDYHATNATLMEINGGTCELKRLPTTLTINGGTVTLDPDDAEDVSGKTINMAGGKLIWKAGAIPTVNLNGGVVDFTKARRAFTPGSTAGKRSSACRIYPHPDVTLTNIIPIGSSKVDIGGATPAP